MVSFNIGDVCRIRQWDDMVAEFGTLNPYGDTSYINVPGLFTPEMRYLCGMTFTIKGEEGGFLLSYEGLENRPSISGHHSGLWRITEGMLEPIDCCFDDKEIKAASKKQLNALLGR